MANEIGGNGGSGVVILRYTSPTQLWNGGTVTQVGGDWVHRFTQNGQMYTGPIVPDQSGNGNFWIPNNISTTAGPTYDVMRDVPTNTNSNTANYCTFNPVFTGNGVVAANGNLQTTNNNGTAGWVSCGTTIAIPTTGKWYIELTVQNYINGFTGAGFYRDGSTQLQGNTFATGANNPNWWSQYGHDSNFYNNSIATPGATTWGAGTVISLAFDSDNGGKPYWGKNGVWMNSANPASNTGSPYTITRPNSQNVYFVAEGYNGIQWSINAGQQPFAYTPPVGFNALNTFNLPTPSIARPILQMDANIYTGTGATQTVANTGMFEPDLTWIKSRSDATSHSLYDVIRGPLFSLSTDSPNMQQAIAGSLTSFNLNGFTVGNSTLVNNLNSTYVAWQWQAGASNINDNTGSLMSLVRANPTAGFSIVEYLGGGGTQTVGHALGIVPSMVIVKCRSNTITAPAWPVWHQALVPTNYLDLQTTQGQSTATSIWNSTAPTATVFSVGTSSSVNTLNFAYIAYCFAPIAGYSAFGTYTGNLLTDGPFVNLGFRPKFVMVKGTTTNSNWFIWDSVRNTANPVTQALVPNSPNAAITPANLVLDFVSNGFKIRNISAAYNTAGVAYLYAAFAENPFKYSLAR